jgi:molybdenum cofactor cytidylyltransferase
MGDSIAAGVRATADAAGWLVLPGDLPLIQPATLRAVAQALARHPVVVPVYARANADTRWGLPPPVARPCGLEGNQGAARVGACVGRY